MITTNPIVPPPELVAKWCAWCGDIETAEHFWQRIATQAAQWGADQELEAILEMGGQQELPEEDRYFDGFTVARIRAARRPKPPSLKEQALEQLGCIQTDLNKFGMGISTDTIRRALEQL